MLNFQFKITQTFLASSIILPHKQKSKNQPTTIAFKQHKAKLFKCCCQTQSKPSSKPTQHFLISDKHASQVTAACYCVCHTQKNTLHVSL